MKALVASVLAASLIGGAAMAQAVPGNGGYNPAPGQTGPYAGAGSPQRFYDVNQRIDHLQARIDGGALAGGRAKAASKQLAAIRQELKFRMARKNGQLLDWDRELITQKLDAFARQYPALSGPAA